MSDETTHKRGIRFDPTINLGHVCTAGAFLVCTALAWANIDGRVGQQAKDIARVEAAANMAMPRTEAKTIETVLIDKIADAKAKTDQTNIRMEDIAREIKASLLRIEVKLDTKADKPGIR